MKENVKYYTDSEIFIDKKSKDYYIYGVDTGSLFICEEKKLYKIIQDHSAKIIDIYINDILNLFASISLDGYINIYTLPQCEILSSFKSSGVSAVPASSMFVRLSVSPVKWESTVLVRRDA